jgi:hypothetical protein
MPKLRPGSLASLIRAKVKADKAKADAKAERAKVKAEIRKLSRIARKVSRSAPPADGLQDLPLSVAVAIEENAARPAKLTPVEPKAEATVDDLVVRLTAIRERIWRLQSVFAVSLSQEIALEANRYLILFQTIANELRAKDAEKLEELVRGHESLLTSPPVLVKPTVSLDAQRFCELRWEASQAPRRSTSPRPADTIHDGMSAFL